MPSMIDVDEFVEAAIFGLAAVGVIALLQEHHRTTQPAPFEPGGYRLSEEEVRQLDLGREVRIHRYPSIPDLELSAEPVDDEE